MLAASGAAAWAKGGPVSVKGYYRKDGTYVKSHTRSAPGSGGPAVVVNIPVASEPRVRTVPRTTPRTEPRTNPREEGRYEANNTKAVTAPTPRNPPTMAIDPAGGDPVPLGKYEDSLGHFALARANKDWPTVASMMDRDLVITVDEPTGVRVAFAGKYTARVEPVEGPHAGTEWYVKNADLKPVKP